MENSYLPLLSSPLLLQYSLVESYLLADDQWYDLVHWDAYEEDVGGDYVEETLAHWRRTIARVQMDVLFQKDVHDAYDVDSYEILVQY